MADDLEDSLKPITMLNSGRKAGFYYLLVVVLSFIYMEYIPSEIVDWETPTNTYQNLIHHKSLFRMGIASGILVHICFILLPLALYDLLGNVERGLSILMVAFAVVSVPISFPALIDQLNLLDKIAGVSARSEVDMALVQSVQDVFVGLHNGFFLNEIFWGLWLFPLGRLVFKSGILPKAIGVLLMLGSLTYMIDVFGGVLFSEFHQYVNTRMLILPAAFGEIGLCLWLLISGVKRQN
ncbi:MAG: DUF4386 domain-containing protein [Flavobacteriia bacterium]|nr:DUF4386 domain-containing protein [Flavobacteriia bacterium]